MIERMPEGVVAPPVAAAAEAAAFVAMVRTMTATATIAAPVAAAAAAVAVAAAAAFPGLLRLVLSAVWRDVGQCRSGKRRRMPNNGGVNPPSAAPPTGAG